MPTYQYACTAASCGHQFDTVQAFSDNALTECPECSGRLRKVWGSIGVVFKGSGFYRNDSRESSKAGPGDGKNGDGKNGDGKNGDGKNGDGKAGSKDAAESKTNANAKSDSSAKGTVTPPAGESSGSTKQAARKTKADASSTSSRKPAAATS